MIVGITAVLLGILAVLLITLIINSRKQTEREAERDAAVILLKEQQIIDAIDMKISQNTGRDRLILVITWKDDQKRKFVFDPLQGVRIGRVIDKNQICVPLDTVSGEHCMIFSNGDSLYVKDLNSANGTFIKRGFNVYKVRDCVPCYDNDIIVVGNIGFKIRSFYIDSAYLC